MGSSCTHSLHRSLSSAIRLFSSFPGILFAMEFFADKIPWVDSVWDAVHTVIRPIGGAFLATRALGHTTPAFEVVVALLGGAMSFASHSLKASTRLVVNTSPNLSPISRSAPAKM